MKSLEVQDWKHDRIVANFPRRVFPKLVLGLKSARAMHEAVVMTVVESQLESLVYLQTTT